MGCCKKLEAPRRLNTRDIEQRVPDLDRAQISLDINPSLSVILIYLSTTTAILATVPARPRLRFHNNVVPIIRHLFFVVVNNAVASKVRCVQLS